MRHIFNLSTLISGRLLLHYRKIRFVIWLIIVFTACSKGSIIRNSGGQYLAAPSLVRIIKYTQTYFPFIFEHAPSLGSHHDEPVRSTLLSRVKFIHPATHGLCVSSTTHLYRFGLLAYGKLTTQDPPYRRRPDHTTAVIFKDHATLTLLRVYDLPPTKRRKSRTPCYQASCLFSSFTGMRTHQALNLGR